MNDKTSKMTRISFECTPEERRLARVMAANEDMSVTQYMRELLRKESASLASGFPINQNLSNLESQ